MRRRVEQSRPMNTWDPLYEAIFNNSKSITLLSKNLTNGVIVEEMGANLCVTKLIQQHSPRG